MTSTHAKRIAFHLEGLLSTIDPTTPTPVVDAIANAVASAYHADSQHDQRVAFALAMLAGASAALQQVEAETGGMADDALAAGEGYLAGRLLDIRKAADKGDTAVNVAAESLRFAANLPR